MLKRIKAGVFVLLLGSWSYAGGLHAAEVYFISPTDGEVIGTEVTVRFGLRGMGVTAAGFEAPNTGHHHLLIDMTQLPDLTLPLPKTEQSRHFGGGQTETVIQLSPGKHTLQLVLGNHLHVPHDPPLISAKITVVVE